MFILNTYQWKEELYNSIWKAASCTHRYPQIRSEFNSLDNLKKKVVEEVTLFTSKRCESWFVFLQVPNKLPEESTIKIRNSLLYYTLPPEKASWHIS